VCPQVVVTNGSFTYVNPTPELPDGCLGYTTRTVFTFQQVPDGGGGA
jgi:hypothetical protein